MSVLEHNAYDTASAETFAERLGGILNAGATAAMMALGHRLGLFDALAEISPATSQELAGHTELAERYVRE